MCIARIIIKLGNIEALNTDFYKINRQGSKTPYLW